MRTMKAVIPQDIQVVLGSSKIVGNVLTLPSKLTREDYLRVARIIEIAGGKWDRKVGGHIFPTDPKAILGVAVASGEIVDKKKTLQLFFTPPEVVERMIALAKIERDHRVLEPSAGTGNIARAIFAITKAVDLVEIDRAMGEALRRKFWNVHILDFMGLDFGPRFDRIVMNPPFSGGDDVRHILHARAFLKPGGRLVAICGNGARQSNMLRPAASHWEALPINSFKEAGTAVNTVLLAIDAD